MWKPAVVEEKLLKELQKGRIAGPFKNLQENLSVHL